MSIKIDILKYYSSRIRNPNKTLEKDRFYQVIEKRDFFLENKVSIMKKLQSIPNYRNKYETIIDIEPLQFGEMNEELYEMTSDEGVFIVTYGFDKNSNMIAFHDYLFSLSTIKKVLSMVITNYQSLLSNIFDLYDNNICFFNLEPENILFYKNRPIMIDFQQTFVTQTYHSTTSLTIFQDHFYSFIMKKTNLIYYPIEIHLFYHMIEKQVDILTYDMIESIYDSFISQLSILTFFSEAYSKKYRQVCYGFLEKYLNKDKTLILNEIIPFSYTWDNYSLSIIFIHLIGSFIRVSGIKETFLNDLLTILSKNIHPSPSKREKINYNMEQLDILFKKHQNWDFIEKLDKIPIERLFDIL
jgi:hypothetical protein